MKRYSTPAEYFDSRDKDKDGLLQLREIMLNCGLDETIKWGTPVYTWNNKNIVGLGSFKTYFGLWYFQGSFLRDEANKLFNAQEGKTKGLRQWRFTLLDDIEPELVKAYTMEAIDNAKAGKEVKVVRSTSLNIPDELDEVLKKDGEFRKAFEALTPGKRKEYCEHIGSAKREATRISRLEKAIQMILNGDGLHDHYR